MKYMMLVIMLAFFGLLIGSNIYLSRRFAWFFSFENTRSLYITFAALTIFMLVGGIAFTNGTSVISNIIYSTAAIIMGFLLYLLLSALTVDLIRIFTKWQPKVYGITTISIAAIVSLYGIWNASNTKTVRISIPVEGIKKEVKVMHLTDIHIGHFWGKNFLQQIVDKTNEQKVDVVFITGDLFDGRIRLSNENLAPLKQLRVPVYFVEGNHDGYTGAKEIKDKLRESGVIVLEDEVTSWGEFQIIGLNHMLADSTSVDMHATGERNTIQEVLSSLSIDKQIPTILLHHSPDGIKYANKKGVDVYLAGHTHAGQMFPINFLGEWIFAYNKGLHDYKGTKIYVSEGAGTFGPPMRVGTKSEITVINLTPIKK